MNHNKLNQFASQLSDDMLLSIQIMGERERVREGERECDSECDGEEGENSSAPRSRRKECSFTVESKAFEIDVDDRKGKIQVFIVEKKGGVSSWV